MELFPLVMRILNEMDSGDAVRLLWNEARNGKESAFVEIYRTFSGPVYRFALHLGGSEAIAEDVVQEVFLLLIRNPELFDPERGPLRSFLLGVARNVTLQLRRNRNQPAEGDSPRENSAMDLSPHVLSDLLQQEKIRRVRHAIAYLPRSYREVIVLCDLEELSYEEAAQTLGCAVGTVRSRLHRARNLLTRKLNEAAKQSKGVNGYGLQIVSATCK